MPKRNRSPPPPPPPSNFAPRQPLLWVRSDCQPGRRWRLRPQGGEGPIRMAEPGRAGPCRECGRRCEGWAAAGARRSLFCEERPPRCGGRAPPSADHPPPRPAGRAPARPPGGAGAYRGRDWEVLGRQRGPGPAGRDALGQRAASARDGNRARREPEPCGRGRPPPPPLARGVCDPQAEPSCGRRAAPSQQARTWTSVRPAQRLAGPHPSRARPVSDALGGAGSGPAPPARAQASRVQTGRPGPLDPAQPCGSRVLFGPAAARQRPCRAGQPRSPVRAGAGPRATMAWHGRLVGASRPAGPGRADESARGRAPCGRHVAARARPARGHGPATVGSGPDGPSPVPRSSRCARRRWRARRVAAAPRAEGVRGCDWPVLASRPPPPLPLPP
jgi:hypothetical protein